jgi:hypothetical protein
MINLPLNFSAPTGQVQNTYAAPAQTNRYLTPSQYQGMQLHTPSGLFYQGGTMYQPYTPAPYNPYKISPLALGNWGNTIGSGGNNWFTGQSNNQSYNNSSSGGPVANSVKIGNQYFKPFTGNAQGIINGDLSMVSMLNKQPTYQPQALPNLFPSLNSNLNSALPQQGMLSSPSYGAGRFTGLLNSPIVTTNTQGK